MTSQVYRYFGVNIVWGRLLVLASMLGSLLVVIALARSLLSQPAALAAVLLFVANRIVNFVSTALQPEAFMLFFYLVAVYGFLKWKTTNAPWAYALCIASTSLSILEKSPAAHLGIFFVLVMLADDGFKATIRNWKNWLLGILALAPAVIWYAHARTLWIAYGNSLGISNENHWPDWDVLTHPTYVLTIGAVEILYVCSLGGILLALFGALGWRQRNVRTMLLWLGSIAIYYGVTIRTTGAYWAFYYHIVSVVPMALLAGAGLQNVVTRCRWHLPRLITAAIVPTACVWLMIAGLDRLRKTPGSNYIADISSARFSFEEAAFLFVVCVAAAVALAMLVAGPRPRFGEDRRATIPAMLCVAGLGIYLFFSANLIGSDLARYRNPSPERLSAEKLRPLVPPGLILTSGWTCDDGRGHKTASDSPYMFYFLDRKGFSMCIAEQSIDRVLAAANRGATSFIAEKQMVRAKPGFEEALKDRFRLIANSDAAWLFDLRPQTAAVSRSGPATNRM
jgi:4-amino-4-deoxy-L-arabinose transferase-like glycosyltransferase